MTLAGLSTDEGERSTSGTEKQGGETSGELEHKLMLESGQRITRTGNQGRPFVLMEVALEMGDWEASGNQM